MNFVGIFYLFLLFAICFAVVHLFKLAYVGFLSIRKIPEPKDEQPEEKPKKEKKPEPVYYIVEKKRARRSKSTYSEPKEIQFK